MAEADRPTEARGQVGFGKTFRLLRLFGIDIEVDVSWLFIFILITVDLAIALFPRMHPFTPVSMHWLMAVLASLGFFATVLLHELGHALVALRSGIPVQRITLFLFGGVAGIEREPDTPKVEFVMAAAGPLVSVLIGAGSLLIGRNLLIESIVLFGPQGIFANPASTLFIWLGSANIMLAVFNLIPGFPLDGGRMLRALIWALSGGRFLSATRIATLLGQGVALAFMGLGIALAFNISLPFLQTGIGNGLWLVFIGWFLKTAARRSWEQAALQHRLATETASGMIDPRPIISLPATATVSELILLAQKHNHWQAFPITTNDMVIGTVAVKQAQALDHELQKSTPVEEIMTPIQNIGVVGREESAESIVSRLKTSASGQLAVIENGQFQGLLLGHEIRRFLGLDDNYELNT